jgi:hypothetical protein
LVDQHDVWTVLPPSFSTGLRSLCSRCSKDKEL